MRFEAIPEWNEVPHGIMPGQWRACSDDCS
jgi:hypothetical protein